MQAVQREPRSRAHLHLVIPAKTYNKLQRLAKNHQRSTAGEARFVLTTYCENPNALDRS